MNLSLNLLSNSVDLSLNWFVSSVNLLSNWFVKFEITEQTGAEIGIVKCELRIYGTGNVCLTSQPFNIEITEPIADAPIITSSSEFKALTQAMSNLESMTDKFDKKYEEITNQFDNKFPVP